MGFSQSVTFVATDTKLRSNEMTRETAKSKIRMSVVVDKDHIKSLEKTDEVINQIYNDHEAQIKAKDEEIAKYQIAIDKQSKRAEALKQLSLDKDDEIATAKMRHKLEHDRYLISEAIIKEKDEEIERLEKALVSALKRMVRK